MAQAQGRGDDLSTEAPHFISENDEILRAVDAVCAAAGQQGLWIMDRGGDRINLFEPMLDRQLQFLFRLIGNRNLLCGGGKALAEDLAIRCPCPYSETIVKQDNGRQKTYTLSFGFRPVRFAGRAEQFCW